MCRKYTDDGLDPEEPQLGPGEQLHVPIMHDETIVRANELHRQVYVCDGKMPLQKKGQGRAIHVSDFIVEQTGRLALSEDQIHKNATLPAKDQLKSMDVREIIYPGKNNDGFWTNDKLVEQVSHNPIIRIIKKTNLLTALGEENDSDLRADVS